MNFQENLPKSTEKLYENFSTKSSQIKSRKRVADHGEVFTAEREVKAMCDLVSDECERIDSRFLEPACGDGNFLAEILKRKLNSVKNQYGKNHADYERFAILAASSIYGVDILADNCELCRNRLYKIWNEEYTKNCGENANEQTRLAAKFILERNIVLGNALSLKKVDEQQADTDEPIIFSEWTFVTSTMLKRRDFRLDVLLSAEEAKTETLDLFDDVPTSQNFWTFDEKTKERIPAPIKEYEPIHYKKLSETDVSLTLDMTPNRHSDRAKRVEVS